MNERKMSIWHILTSKSKIYSNPLYIEKSFDPCSAEYRIERVIKIGQKHKNITSNTLHKHELNFLNPSNDKINIMKQQIHTATAKSIFKVPNLFQAGLWRKMSLLLYLQLL